MEGLRQWPHSTALRAAAVVAGIYACVTAISVLGWSLRSSNFGLLYQVWAALSFPATLVGFTSGGALLIGSAVAAFYFAFTYFSVGAMGLLLRATRIVARVPFPRGRCPECGYSLSGLQSEERCPECGSQIEHVKF